MAKIKFLIGVNNGMVPKACAEKTMLSLCTMDMSSYPHITMVSKKLVRESISREAKIVINSGSFFGGTFKYSDKPSWLHIHYNILEPKRAFHDTNFLFVSNPKTKRPILDSSNQKYHHAYPPPKSLHSEKVNIGRTETNIVVSYSPQKRKSLANNEEEKEKENGEGDGCFTNASKLLGKKTKFQNPPQQTENNSKCHTEGIKNGRKKFVPPFANPEKRAEFEGSETEQPRVSKVKKDEGQENQPKKGHDHLIEQIESEILDGSPSVQWEDIIGLDYAKKTIEEILILPITLPELKEIISFPKGVLLFGPPGTGKTMIAKAVATQCKSTFFNISASILTSKWMGEGEKLVRALFEVAKTRQPSIIFIDEIDSLLCARSDSDFESSRRLKTEFLIRMDGVTNGSGQDDQVIIIGATNRPQEIDEAVRRRLGKRLYIPLPNKEGRVDFLSKALAKCKIGHSVSVEEIDKLATITKGYSGADLKCLISEAAMYPVRSMISKKNISISEIKKISYDDFAAALSVVKATVSKDDLSKYLEWNKTFGSYPFIEKDLDT